MTRPPRPARTHPASKREQILDEAFRLLGQSGYRGLSFQELADRCLLTKQGVLHYFPTKPGLLFALLDERDASVEGFLLDQLAANNFDQAADATDSRTILRGSLVAVVQHMIESPNLIPLHVVLRAEATSVDHPAREYFLKRDRATLDWLIRHLSPFEALPTSSARQILATMLGLQQQWVQETQGFDLLAEWRYALSRLL